MKHYSTVLSIAGSDPIGGAGIQADIKTCCSLGVFAMTGITAITAQNTTGVKSFASVGADMLRAQLDAVLADVRPDAVKIGMVPDSATAAVIADVIEAYDLQNVVLDPVMVATSGDALSDGTAMAVLAARVFPRAAVITPNLVEARALAAMESSDAKTLAAAIRRRYACRAVLVKGGHADGDNIEDLLDDGGSCHSFAHSKIDSVNTHGTGCSLSSAIACGLAKGLPVEKAVGEAVAWLHNAIVEGKEYEFGHGHGPVHYNGL